LRVLIVHNEYGAYSGEEAIVDMGSRLLAQRGHQLFRLSRSSTEIPKMRLGRIRAFFSGIYNFSSVKTMQRCVDKFRPNVVHVHNLFPLISPSVLKVCSQAGIAVVMTVHNHRLICPNGLFMKDGQMCQKCAGGREYWCIFRNCQSDIFRSFGYAVRNYIARKGKFFLENVTMYAVVAQFQRLLLIREGFPADRIVVIPNAVVFNGERAESDLGDYVGYIGRISAEKGIINLFKTASRNPDIPFKLAGAVAERFRLPVERPENIELVGYLYGAKKYEFYKNARIIVLPSICLETFGNTIVEAMLHGKAIVCSRIGGLQEIVEDGVTGLLFEPGNADELGEKIRYLWSRPDLCSSMGQAGRYKAQHEYSTDNYYDRLMGIYSKAMSLIQVR